MLPVDHLVSARIADIALGNLALHPFQGYGIVVETPEEERRSMHGVLLRPQTDQAEYKRPFAFSWSNDYWLDLGVPKAQWNGGSTALSPVSRTAPPIGHLVVVREMQCISGLAPRSSFGDPVYWELKTGKVLQRLDYTSAIYINQWSLGVMEIATNFRELVKFDAVGD